MSCRVALRLAWRTVGRRPRWMLLAVITISMGVALGTLAAGLARFGQATTGFDTSTFPSQTWQIGDESVPREPDLVVHEAALLIGPDDDYIGFGSYLVDGTDLQVERLAIMREGRWATSEGEIVIDLWSARRLVLDVGGTVDVRPWSGENLSPAEKFTVVGIIDGVSSWPIAYLDDSEQRFARGPRTLLYVDAVDGAAMINDGDSFDFYPALAGTLFAAVALILPGLLAAVSLMSGFERRLREVGLLEAGAGAEPSTIIRWVLTEAALVGTAAGVLGTTLGFALLKMAPLWPQAIVDSFPTDSTGSISAVDLMGPFVIGIVFTVLAGLLPAARTAQVSTAEALTGQTPNRNPERWTVPLAIGFAGGGFLLMLIDSMIDELTAGFPIGVALVLVGVAFPASGLPSRLADWQRMPTWGRLVIREVSRNRIRLSLAMVVSAVLFALFALVTLTEGEIAQAAIVLVVAVGLESALISIEAHETADQQEILRRLGAPPASRRLFLGSVAAYQALLGVMLPLPLIIATVLVTDPVTVPRVLAVIGTVVAYPVILGTSITILFRHHPQVARPRT